MERDQAVEWLTTAKKARRQARIASHRAWFPLVIFGLITLGSLPFYSQPLPAAGGTREGTYLGGYFVNHPARLSMYWVLAAVIGYAATVAYFRWQDARSGVRTTVWPFVTVGLGLLGVMLLSAFRGVMLNPNLVGRGLSPILTIAFGLLVLAATERTWVFRAFAVGYFAVALMVNLYDIGNVTSRIGLGQHGVQANVVLAGAVLLAGGIAFAVTGRDRQ